MKEHFHVENKREVKMKDYYEMDFFFFFFLGTDGPSNTINW
jgi:hypothetical protein